MSKIQPDSSFRVSYKFQKRLEMLIADEECTKYQFAKNIGVSRDVISRALLYAIVPSLRSLLKICDYLDISLYYLLGETSDISFCKSENPATFQERLKLLMTSKAIKYSQLAHVMPFPESYFYEWQSKNTIPSLDNLSAIANYFNVSLDYLLGRTDFTKN